MSYWISRIVVAASLVATLAVLTGDVFGGSPKANLTAAQGTVSNTVVVDQSASPIVDQADWQLTAGRAGRISSSSSTRR